MIKDSTNDGADAGRRTLMTSGAAMLLAATAAPRAHAQSEVVKRVLVGPPMSTNEGGCSIRVMTFNFGNKPVGGRITIADLVSGEPLGMVELPALPGRKGHAEDILLGNPTQFVSVWRLTGAADGVIASLELRSPSGQLMGNAKIGEATV